jgi:Sulfotransferase family
MGTPRSGTTLAQRLASEIPGVSVPPETCFFPFFALGLIRRHQFPIDGATVRAELTALPNLAANLAVAGKDSDDLASAIGDRCDRPSDLYASLVRTLAGPAEIYGEKTPGNLLWLPVLARDLPRLRFIAIVRDPRAVAASQTQLTIPFGRRTSLEVAELWRRDQRLLSRTQAALGSRLLIIRYEDMVAAPDQIRQAIGVHIGLPSGTMCPVDRPLFLARETWKGNALGPVTTDRVESWHEIIGRRQAAQILSICRSGLKRFGYPAPSFRSSLVARAGIAPRDHVAYLKRRYSRIQLERRIRHAAV